MAGLFISLNKLPIDKSRFHNSRSELKPHEADYMIQNLKDTILCLKVKLDKLEKEVTSLEKNHPDYITYNHTETFQAGNIFIDPETGLNFAILEQNGRRVSALIQTPELTYRRVDFMRSHGFHFTYSLKHKEYSFKLEAEDLNEESSEWIATVKES